jgi:hypothetical protein
MLGLLKVVLALSAKLPQFGGAMAKVMLRLTLKS